MQQMARKPFMGNTNAPTVAFRQEPRKSRFRAASTADLKSGAAMVNHS